MLALTKNALSGGESATKMIQILGMQWVRNNKCFSEMDSVQLNVNVDWGLSRFVLCWLRYDTNWFVILGQLPRKLSLVLSAKDGEFEKSRRRAEVIVSAETIGRYC